MARWTGTWISGLAAAGGERPAGVWPGRRYGFPEDGPGAVATTGSRVAAFVVDLLAGALIGRLLAAVFFPDLSPLDQNLLDSAAVAAQLLVLQALTGQSLGMRLIGIRVARLADPAAVPGFLPVAIRTALLLLVVPAVVIDREGRGLHDKAGGTVVLRADGARTFAG